MSGKSASSRSTKEDRRVRRTRNALGDALIALIQEKKFADITVQQVLDRAGVGRTTFYKHFQDKDDLFLSDLEDFFEAFSTLLIRHKEASNRIAPVRELFSHVGENRNLHSALVAADKLHDFQEMAQEYFARGIGQRLRQLGRPAQDGATVQALAGSLLSMMTWWLRSGSKSSPEQMDDIYHRMVWAGLSPSEISAGKPELPARIKSKNQQPGLNRKSGRTIPRG